MCVCWGGVRGGGGRRGGACCRCAGPCACTLRRGGLKGGVLLLRSFRTHSLSIFLSHPLAPRTHNSVSLCLSVPTLPLPGHTPLCTYVCVCPPGKDVAEEVEDDPLEEDLQVGVACGVVWCAALWHGLV